MLHSAHPPLSCFLPVSLCRATQTSALLIFDLLLFHFFFLSLSHCHSLCHRQGFCFDETEDEYGHEKQFSLLIFYRARSDSTRHSAMSSVWLSVAGPPPHPTLLVFFSRHMTHAVPHTASCFVLHMTHTVPHTASFFSFPGT